MREALGGLTSRGKAMLWSGVGLALFSFLIGESDILRVAGIFVVLPFLSAIFLALARYRLDVSRSIDPARVETGQSSNVSLRVRNTGRSQTGTLMFEDRIPYILGVRPRLVLERLLSGSKTSISYQVQAPLRGKYDIGPLLVRSSDPFGLVEITRSYPVIDKLTVVPSITPLPAIRLPGEFAGSGDNRAKSVAVHGEDDAATREYRYGDDLRRVHWRSTARTGKIMVRREEQPWDSRATIVLDTRAGAHRGEGTSSTFEWSVSATASISHHLHASGYKLRLVSETDNITPDTSNPGAILDHLAGVQVQRQGNIHRLIAQLRQQDHGGLIIATLGSLMPSDADQLSVLSVSGTTCIALLLDTASWTDIPQNRREHADREFHDSRLKLMRAGWKVIPVRVGDFLPGLWRELAHGPQGFAYRAAMAETVSKGSE